MMREATLDLIRAIIVGIAADEALADEAARVARMCDDEGVSASANAMRAIARNHRIRVMEARGRLAVLTAPYTADHHDEL